MRNHEDNNSTYVKLKITTPNRHARKKRLETFKQQIIKEIRDGNQSGRDSSTGRSYKSNLKKKQLKTNQNV